MKKRKRELPWRVQSNDDGGFDELVVGGRVKGNTCLIHAEMMNRRAIFVSVGELRVWAHVEKDGTVKVTMIENETGVKAWEPPQSSGAEEKKP